MFLQVDPIDVTAERLLDPQLMNPYAYARGNPLKYVDPTGEMPVLGYGLGLFLMWWTVDGSSPRTAHDPVPGENIYKTEANAPMSPLEAIDLAAGVAGLAKLGVAGAKFLFNHADEMLAFGRRAVGNEIGAIGDIGNIGKPVPASVMDDGFGGFRARFGNDPDAIAEFAPQGDGIRLDYINRGSQPHGSGGIMLADALKKAGIGRPGSVNMSNVINKETLGELVKSADPASTRLGKTIEKMAKALGGKVTSWETGVDKTGKTWMKAKISY